MLSIPFMLNEETIHVKQLDIAEVLAIMSHFFFFFLFFQFFFIQNAALYMVTCDSTS